MTLQLGLLRWIATLVGVQMLCGIAWVLGPLVSILEPVPARLALVMALILLWAAANLAIDLLRARRDTTLTQGVSVGAAGEEAAIGQKLASALVSMRKANGRRCNLYDQPWYAIIGPPGAGKTTALLNAGLVFPLAGELGPGPVAGVGGTRLCDWWFTADAVLIDTAGRYTTQDSDQAVDRAGWEAFLALLRRTRPRQPLNGVIVAIALADIVGDPALLQAHARAIRARIDEMDSRLGLRVPVYAVFTKADLLVGFSEFFDDLDRAGRNQVWGATFPLNAARDPAAALRPLLERLDRRVFARLAAEDNADRRALIAGFPAQFASVLAPLQDFVARTFGPEVTGKTPLLRGLYLASGTQEGAPIDRLLGALSRSFGLDQRRSARLRPEAGRSYFLGGLLRDVVFREAPLVAYRPGANRRKQVLRLSGFAACALLALAGTAAIWFEQAAHQGPVAHAAAATRQHAATASELPLDPVADAEFADLVPWLDAAAASAHPGPMMPDRLGFAQDAKLEAAGRAQYRHALEYALLPRLVWRVETVMRGLLGQPDALYEVTRVDLMLGGAGPVDRALLQDFYNRIWADALPGDDNAGTRAALSRHLAALLENPLPPIPLDGVLIQTARAVIGRVDLAQRAYSRLKPTVAALDLPPWRPSDTLGPAGVRVFLRLSGTGLEVGVPGVYTIDGFKTGVQPALRRAADEAIAEGWVLGRPIEVDAAHRQALEGEILALYARDYAAAWDAVLSDLDPAPLRSLTQAAQDLFILGSSHSPIRAVLASAARQLAPGLAAVDDRFRPLRALFGSGGGAPIDQVLRPVSDLQQQLAKLAASTTRPAAPAPGEDPAAALRAEGARQPQPLSRWLIAIATGGGALRDGGPRGAMVAAWNAGGGPGALCAATIANRYPFVPTATDDAALDDVIRLLGPGGVINAFFNAQLKPFVDMTARPWKLQPVDGVAAPLTAGDLAQFQRAATIRDLLFPAGSVQPSVRLEITPGPLDPGVTAATLELGTATLSATRDGPPRPTVVTWPGQPRATLARLTLSTGGTPLLKETSGPWALFRFIEGAKATAVGDRVALAVPLNDRTARYQLRAVPNPFTGTAFSDFRCPVVL